MTPRRAVRDLVITAFQAHADAGRNLVSRKQILKALYMAKMDLPPGNPAAAALPYYWYLNGPFSDTVYAELTSMINDGTIYRAPDTRFQMFTLKDGISSPTFDGNMAAAAELVRTHADNFTTVDNMLKDVYAKHQPYKFYTSYKLNFTPLLESHCGAIIDYGGTPDGTCEMALDALTDSLLDIPPGKGFMRFRFALCSYARSIRVLFRVEPDHDMQVRDDVKTVRSICSSIWTAFGYNTCLFKHDPFYNSHVDAWKSRLDDHMAKVDKETADLERSIDRLPIHDEFTTEMDVKIEQSLKKDHSKARAYEPQEYLKIIKGL